MTNVGWTSITALVTAIVTFAVRRWTRSDTIREKKDAINKERKAAAAQHDYDLESIDVEQLRRK